MEVSENIRARLAAMESVKPVSKHPPNLRLFEIGPLNVALMANPESYSSPYGMGLKDDEGIDSRRSIAKVHALGIRWMIAFDITDYKIIESRWREALKSNGVNGEAYLFETPDHYAIAPDVLDEVSRIALEAHSHDSGVVFYCHGGFGRSGTAAASLVLRELLANPSKSGSNSAPSLITNSKADLSPKIADIYKEPHLTTPNVYSSISTIRLKDPQDDLTLRDHNPRSSLYGISVETKAQILALEALEQALIIARDV